MLRAHSALCTTCTQAGDKYRYAERLPNAALQNLSHVSLPTEDKVFQYDAARGGHVAFFPAYLVRNNFDTMQELRAFRFVLHLSIHPFVRVHMYLGR